MSTGAVGRHSLVCPAAAQEPDTALKEGSDARAIRGRSGQEMAHPCCSPVHALRRISPRTWHLQIVDEGARSIRLKYAHEKRAQEFAMYWRNELRSEPLPHSDPVHNPPVPAEFEPVSSKTISSGLPLAN